MATAFKSKPMTDAEWQARQQLAACYRIFAYYGWDELIYTHISLRVPDEDEAFLINPFGLHYSEVTASNLLKIDIDGNKLCDSNYPVNRAGFVQHSLFHRHLPDAHCIMHTHTTAGMAVSLDAGGPDADQLLRRFLRRPDRLSRLRGRHDPRRRGAAFPRESGRQEVHDPAQPRPAGHG
jgi:ribulose-5-phosphate 4-epimerase/fuculose-1-phosphate aldolase